MLMQVVVVGLGYVGSVCAACLASRGHRVIGVDTAVYKVDCIERGESPIVENDLPRLMAEARATGRLSATTRIEEAMEGAEVVLVCVGTPSAPDGSLDLGHVKRAVNEVGTAIGAAAAFPVVVMRSTMLPGSVHDELVPALERASGRRVGVDFGIAYNPEFLREGTAVSDFFGAEYTVIGADDERSFARLRDVYEGIGGELIHTSVRTAEMLKYVNNAYHALKVTFANEVGRLCKHEAVDSHEVMSIFCRDTRLNLSAYYLRPGFAFGGSCLPKDLRALQSRAHRHGLDLPVIGNVMRSNDLHVEAALHLIERFKKRRVGVLGLSFKSETDDLRESPILRVVAALVGKGFSLLLHDPNVDIDRLLGSNRRFVETEIPYLPERLRANLADVVENSDVLVVANGSKPYRDIGRLMKPGQVLVDLVHSVDPATVPNGGYHGLVW
jgi:GDP-mannose 6-dehydrogenase